MTRAVLASREASTDETVVALYRTYGAVVYARCQKLLGDGAEAEDATQETFIRVFRHIHKVADPSEAVRWIYRIATNYCLNEIRNRRTRPAPVHSIPERDDRGAAEDRLVDRDVIGRALERAAPRVRTAAWLYHVDGFEQEEIAKILGVSRRTVASRLAAFAKVARKIMNRSGG